MRCLPVFVLLCIAASHVDLSSGLKILGIMPLHGRSHYYPFAALMQGLAEKGHQVTFITPFSPAAPIKNLDYVTLDKTGLPAGEMLSFDEISKIFGGNSVTDFSFKMLGVFIFKNASKTTCDDFLSSDVVQAFKKRKQHFDLVLTEAFHTDCWFPFAAEYQAPLVHFTASLPMPWYNDRFGQPSNPAYIPNMLTGFSMKMSFYERLQNMIIDQFHKFYFDYIQEPTNDEYASNFFGANKPDRHDIANNASLLLINTHYSLLGPRPFVPGLVEVGGIHVTKGPKPVPQVRNINRGSMTF